MRGHLAGWGTRRDFGQQDEPCLLEALSIGPGSVGAVAKRPFQLQAGCLARLLGQLQAAFVVLGASW